MQPLISPVEHESRRQYYDEETPVPIEAPHECTPLLGNVTPNRRSNLIPIFILVMLAVLIFGIVASIFLLLEEDEAWPVDLSFEMISRSEWEAKSPRWVFKNLTEKPVPYIILTHTNTIDCFSFEKCKNLLLDTQKNFQNSSRYNMTDLPFNFMISGDGLTYEGRGWNIAGEVDQTHDLKSLSLAVIGNFTTDKPTVEQLMEIKSFLDESIWRGKLQANYSIIGRPCFNSVPTRLFLAVQHWNHWKSN